MKFCCVDGCDEFHSAKTYCKRHYNQFKKNGFTYKSFFDMTLEEKLKDGSKINEETGCIEWFKSTTKKGYGKLRHKKIIYTAHRLSYSLKFDLPDEVWVLHSCDNPCCINVDHLFPGNNDINVKDKVKKNRQSRMLGESHPRSKLKEKDIHAIRKMRVDGVKVFEISKIYNVDLSSIYLIVNNKTWKHI